METEIERLLVRLVGDAEGYFATLQQAQAKTVQATRVINNNVQGVSSRINQFGGGLRLFGERAAEAFTSLAIASRLRAALFEWQASEDAVTRLNSILKVNGRNVNVLSEQYQKFASDIQEQTVLTDEAVIGLLRQAETYGLTGEAAENAARAAIGFSGAVNGTSEGAAQYMRMAAQLEKGNVKMAMQFARMIPQLRGIKDQTLFVAEAQRLIAAGLQTSTDEANTSSGSIKRLKNAFSDLMEELGKTVADGLKPFIEGMRDAVRFVKAMSPEAKAMAVKIAAIGAAVIGAQPAWAALRFFFGSIFDIVSNVVKEVVSLTVTVVALAAKTVFTVVWAAGWLLVKGAIWLVNAALAGTLTLTLALQAAFAIIAGAAVVGVFVVLGVAIWAAWEAGKAVVDVFRNLPSMAGPIQAITGMFGEWWTILKAVVRAIKVDASLAWEILAAGGRLAVEQIKALWPPLWGYIKSSSAAVWKFIIAKLEFKFYEGLANIGSAYVKFIDSLPALMAKAARFILEQFIRFNPLLAMFEAMTGIDIAGEITKQILGAQEAISEEITSGFEKRLNSLIKDIQNAESELRNAQTKLMKDFAAGVFDTEGVEKAQKELDQLLIRLKEAEADAGRQKTLKDPFPNMAKDIAAATKEMQKFDAALVGSQEAFARIQAFKELRIGEGGVIQVPRLEADDINVNGDNQADDADGEQVAVLKDIRGIMQAEAKKPELEVAPANLA